MHLCFWLGRKAILHRQTSKSFVEVKYYYVMKDDESNDSKIPKMIFLFNWVIFRCMPFIVGRVISEEFDLPSLQLT